MGAHHGFDSLVLYATILTIWSICYIKIFTCSLVNYRAVFHVLDSILAPRTSRWLIAAIPVIRASACCLFVNTSSQITPALRIHVQQFFLQSNYTFHGGAASADKVITYEFVIVNFADWFCPISGDLISFWWMFAVSVCSLTNQTTWMVMWKFPKSFVCAAWNVRLRQRSFFRFRTWLIGKLQERLINWLIDWSIPWSILLCTLGLHLQVHGV